MNFDVNFYKGEDMNLFKNSIAIGSKFDYIIAIAYM